MTKMRMPFGKHKGEPVEDVPADYLEWFLGNIENIDTDLQEEMEKQVDMKNGKGAAR